MNSYVNVGDTQHFYAYQRNNYEQSHFTQDTYMHHEEISNQYHRLFQPIKVREYNYCIPMQRAKELKTDYTRYKQDFFDWARLLYQITIPNEYNANRANIKKPDKVIFELLELKTDGKNYELLIWDCIKNSIVTWGYLPNTEKIKEYLKKNPFPKDALYTEQMFWEDSENAYGYISLIVEKRETGQFICDLCSALSTRYKISKRGYKNEN
jgi:hypothetical protein